jgi:hypothetical protein
MQILKIVTQSSSILIVITPIRVRASRMRAETYVTPS